MGTCKSSCVVIINGTFVVAMQKKETHVLHFLCNHLKLWPCRKRSLCVCLPLGFSLIKEKTKKQSLPKNEPVQRRYFSMRAHLHWAWLFLVFANSRSPWVDFCCIYHTTDSLCFEELGIVGGLTCVRGPDLNTLIVNVIFWSLQPCWGSEVTIHKLSLPFLKMLTLKICFHSLFRWNFSA